MYLASVRPCSARLSTGRPLGCIGRPGCALPSAQNRPARVALRCVVLSPVLAAEVCVLPSTQTPFGWSKGRSCSAWDTARLGAFLPQSHVARTCAWQTTGTAMPPVPGQPPAPPRARLHMRVRLVHNCSLWIDALGNGSPTLLLPSLNSGPQRGSVKIQNPRKP